MECRWIFGWQRGNVIVSWALVYFLLSLSTRRLQALATQVSASELIFSHDTLYFWRMIFRSHISRSFVVFDTLVLIVFERQRCGSPEFYIAVSVTAS